MKDISLNLVNTNGVVFPDTEAINSTGPLTTDGTEWIKAGIDEDFGRAQAIMDHAGLTPDGVTEAAGTAQIIEALQKGFGAPPGAIMEWPAVLDPAVSGHRAILLQGQGILRANFPELDAAVFVGADPINANVAAGGGAFYRADDAAGVTPNDAGVWLILPETRGLVPRGLDLAASIDPDGASRFLGDLQVDAAQGHWHNIQFTGGTDDVLNNNDGTGGTVNGREVSRGTVGDRAAIETTDPVTDGVNGTPRISSETRMYNRSTTYIIWY